MEHRGRKRGFNPWPLFIVCLGVGFLGFSAWSIQRASNEVSEPLKDRSGAYKRYAPDRSAQ